MGTSLAHPAVLILSLAVLFGCAAPAPTATPTQPAAAVATPTKAGPTPTKAPTATPTKRPVTKISVAIASAASLSDGPTWVARGKGYFEQEGLDVDWVVAGSGAKALAAAVGRSSELADSAPAAVMAAVAQGQPVQSFATLTVGQPQTLLVGKAVAERLKVTEQWSAEQKVRALKGMQIGSSSPGSGADVATRYILNRFGVDPDRDVEITYIGLAALLPALEKGSVDAIVQTEPDVSQAIVRGYGVPLVSLLGGDLPEVGDTLWLQAVSHRDIISSRQEILESYVRALWRGMRLLKENLNDAKEAVRTAGFSDMERDVFDLAFETLYKRGFFPDSPAVTEQQFRATVDYTNKTTKDPPPIPKLEDFYTPKIVEAAKKQLGY